MPVKIQVKWLKSFWVKPFWFKSFGILFLLTMLANPLFAQTQDETYQRLQSLIRKAEEERNAQNAPPGSPPPVTEEGTPGTTPPANLTEAPPPPPRRLPTLREQAFKQLLDKLSPLTPEQIVRIRKRQDQTEQAVATTPNTLPRPVSSTLTIDLSPGVTPPVIRLSAGFVTSVVFVDSTGQPWPIADYNLGSPKNFNIQWDRKTNTLFVQGNVTYSSGNLAVRLATLETPVMLSLVSGQKEVDYRVDLQVQGRGPNAQAPVGEDVVATINPMLLSVLDGIPPPRKY